MTIAYIGEAGYAGGNHGPPIVIDYASGAGSTLILAGHFYNDGNNASLVPLGITDSAGNTWQYSANNASTPPTFQAADPADGPQDYFADFVAWCINAAAVTSVTITYADPDPVWTRATLSEWSGIVQFDNSYSNGSASGALSAPLPVMLNAPNELVVSAGDFGGNGAQSLPTGWTGFSSSGTIDCGYYLPGATTGSYTPTWTNSISASWVGAVAVFSPVPIFASSAAPNMHLPALVAAQRAGDYTS